MKREEEKEFERFEKMTDGLLSVPRSELKKKLEAEKKAKKRTKSKRKPAGAKHDARA